jgi:phosphoribosylglycinamide formyltransferase-1
MLQEFPAVRPQRAVFGVWCAEELPAQPQVLASIPMSKPKIGVLVSGRGRGSNFTAIARAAQDGTLSAEVALLVATHEEHGALETARALQIPTLVLPLAPGSDSDAWEQTVRDALLERGVSCVALAGFMRRIGPVLLNAFPSCIANVHPSLLPAFGGEGMWGKRVHQAVIEYGCRVSGCTVHLLDERYDEGPIIGQSVVPVEDADTPETLAARVLQAEHQLYARCLSELANDALRLEGRRVLSNR